jgi:hypothetical protein
VLSLDVRNQRIFRPAEINLIALLQVAKSDEDVVSGIELKDSLHLKASSVVGRRQIEIRNDSRRGLTALIEF